MADALATSLLFSSFFIILIFSQTQATKTFKPKAFLLPVSKDPSTLQYTTQIKQRKPLVHVKLTVDVGGQFTWINCEGYVSSSYKNVPCESTICQLSLSGACTTECYSPQSPGCYNNTCDHIPYNPFIKTSTGGEMATDIAAIQSTNGKNPGKVVSVPDLVFTCGSTSLLEGLSKGAQGMAGLGLSNLSLPAQFSSILNIPNKFAMCLSSSTKSNGVVIFGDGPYVFLPGVDASKSLIYTPLTINPVSTAGSYFSGQPSTDYFINVTSILVNGKSVKVNTSFLSIQGEDAVGGTKISTVDPYTVLETSIYKAVITAFKKEAQYLKKVASIKPFKECFSSKNVASTRVGPAVPPIDLVLHKKSAIWRIFGANSMVQVKQDVMCLGFVDGGVAPRTSIVIGGHQLEDNLVKIDLAKARLGFSSSLLFKQTTCANFNFTSV